MKKFFSAVGAVALLLSLGSCGPKFETVPGDPMQSRIYTLDNGLKVYMTVNKETPRIQTYIAVKVGSKNDPSETTGLAHYFEHLMFKGTEQFGTSDYAAEEPMLDRIEALFETYRSTTDEAERAAIYHEIDSVSYEASKLAIPNEYDKLMALIGANGTNAWTSSDETVYTEDIPSNQIDNWARIQADRFRHGVIRGFHTELETIYEEKNMSLTQDQNKIWETLNQALFPHHPYGRQTTLGSQEHLKNPSITNVKKYHDCYYVPNNIAICLSGDFDPKEMVAVIEKYFGDWEPNPDIPELKFEPEAPIAEPVVKETYGLESEILAMGWRLPGAKDFETAAVAEIAASILSNGTAGIFDLEVNQQQKAMYLAASHSPQPDYSTFIVMGLPKAGQTLEQLKDLALEELAKLRNGDFSEDLIAATVNNLKYSKMLDLDNNRSRAQLYVDAFINGVDWKDACRDMERYSKVTKEDVVAFAGKYLSDNACAIVYKRQGEDRTVQKISAPKITPIVTNRDKQSDFLKEVQASKVKPIEPVFVDFSRDMSKFNLADGVEVLYKHNEINDIFYINMEFNKGLVEYPLLGMAFDYLQYLGTEDMSAEQFSTRMYELGCNYRTTCGPYGATVVLRGLGENMGEALKLLEHLITGAVADEDILEHLKSDLLKDRSDSKKSQRACYSALKNYMTLGPDYVKSVSIPDDALKAARSEDVLAAVKEVYALGHVIKYYGPAGEPELKQILSDNHKIAEGAVLGEEQYAPYVATPEDRVVIAPYDAKQIYYYQYSDNGQKLDVSQAPLLSLYNEYFGGGMNGIVFQEMREARGLAYSAWADYSQPAYVDDTYTFTAFIATQNDKMRQAVEAFDSIIEDMPVSEAAFSVAKQGLENRLRTQRVTGLNVLNSYLSCRRMGIEEPLSRQIFEALPNLSLEDVQAYQKEHIKGRHYTYGILGDESDLDMEFLSTLGPVTRLSLEDIFGY